jgi:folate-dependent phosphoribosylglycinamide formyltransferase PurN
MSERKDIAGGPAESGRPRLAGLRDLAKSFDRDERGLKVVEMLLLLFVAAIILIGFLKIFFPEVLQKVKDKVMELLGMEVTG